MVPKRSSNTAGESTHKIVDPSFADAEAAKGKSQAGGALRRTTTLQKIGTGSSMIQSPDGPNTKTERSFHGQKGANSGSGNAEAEKRRQTIGSPNTVPQKKSEGRSSEGYKMSAPGSITNSSNQQPLKFHSSQKPSNNNTFSTTKQSNNNTSRKFDHTGAKKAD